MRPFYLYFFLWLIPLSSSVWFVSDYNVGLSSLALMFISSLILVFLMSNILMSIVFYKKPTLEKIISKFDRDRSIYFQSKIVYLWLFIFICEIIYSGGLPAFWGGQRGYSEFGIPTIHGLSNMLRGLMLSNLVMFFIFKFNIPKSLVFFTIFSLLSAIFLEQSRGAFIVTICFAIAPLMLFMKISFKNMLKIVTTVCIILPTFSVFQFVRYAESPINELISIGEFVQGNEEAYKYLIEPVANYIATPALNAGLNIDKVPFLILSPSETIKPLLPSFIRNYIFAASSGVDGEYGELINKAFNTTSFITPFVRDYGLIGGFSILSIFLFYCNYVFAKARCGSPWHIIAASPLMMCIALSIFNSYLTSLITLVYLLVSGISARRMMRL